MKYLLLLVIPFWIFTTLKIGEMLFKFSVAYEYEWFGGFPLFATGCFVLLFVGVVITILIFGLAFNNLD